jgi:hypothetical protein
MSRHIDRDDLNACVAELLDRDRLLERVHELLPDVDASGWSEGKQKLKKQPVAPTPWNDAAAGVLTDVHAGVRSHETRLTLALFQRARYRGHTDANTAAALYALPNLIVAADERAREQGDRYARSAAAEAARDLQAWPREARRLLDEARHDEQTWTKAPGKLRCPYCDRRLELRPGWDQAREDDVVARSLYCRRCPGAEYRTQSWPATTWLAVLQDGEAARAASGVRGA